MILRYYLDLSVDDTAEVMGCAPGTVKASTNHAIAWLRRDRHLFAVTELS